jgi:hypothetical protein
MGDLGKNGSRKDNLTKNEKRREIEKNGRKKKDLGSG